MENEYRERETPKTRYEQIDGNPMDAVKGKRPRYETAEGSGSGSKKGPKNISPDSPKGNEYHEKEKEAPKSTEKVKSERLKKGPTKRPGILVQVLNGDILTRDFVLNNLTFIFFILFLLLLVVGKGYYGKQQQKDIEALQTDVNATTAEYIENKAKLEEMTTRYRLVEMLEPRGLKEALKPAKVIRLKTPKK
jgi:hypothetical protein